MLPPFIDDVLPPGDYALTIGQLRENHLVTGTDNPSVSWDRKWRRTLVGSLEILVEQLWRVGIDQIFINGSFVENKDHPSDIDGYFETDVLSIATGQLQRSLNSIDPNKAWTWDHNQRRFDPSTGKMQLPMWHIYHVELYYHFPEITALTDLHGNSLEFPAAFRKTKADGREKGIIQIVPEREERSST
jgi:hypothetical protein